MSTSSSLTLAKEVNIKVTNIEANRGGNMIVMIFGKDGFPIAHDKAILIQKQPAKYQMNFTFTVKNEEFAIKVLHDEDENDKVTKNWTGIIPAEGLGFSNGQKLSLTGPPSYRKSKILLSNIDQIIEIKIIYP